MSLRFDSWLCGLWVRLSDACPGSALRRKDKRRRRLRPSLEALGPRATPVAGRTSLAPGADVIDVGQPTQTVANSLKPYGMVYDLVQNQHIPVGWAIHPNKAVFGAPANVGAMRACFDFILQDAIAHTPPFMASSSLKVHP